jgi:hypothetical protein
VRSSVLTSASSGSPSGGGLRHVAMNQNTAVLNGPTTFSGLPVAPLPRTSGSPWMNPLPTPSAQTSICNDNVDGQPSALRDDVPRTVSTTDAMGITDSDLTSSKTWPPFSKNKLELRPRNKRKRREMREPTEFSRWDPGLQRMISWEV